MTARVKKKAPARKRAKTLFEQVFEKTTPVRGGRHDRHMVGDKVKPGLGPSTPKRARGAPVPANWEEAVRSGVETGFQLGLKEGRVAARKIAETEDEEHRRKLLASAERIIPDHRLPERASGLKAAETPPLRAVSEVKPTGALALAIESLAEAIGEINGITMLIEHIADTHLGTEETGSTQGSSPSVTGRVYELHNVIGFLNQHINRLRGQAQRLNTL